MQTVNRVHPWPWASSSGRSTRRGGNPPGRACAAHLARSTREGIATGPRAAPSRRDEHRCTAPAACRAPPSGRPPSPTSATLRWEPAMGPRDLTMSDAANARSLQHSLRGLDWLNFLLAGALGGFGPLVAVYL